MEGTTTYRGYSNNGKYKIILNYHIHSVGGVLCHPFQKLSEDFNYLSFFKVPFVGTRNLCFKMPTQIKRAESNLIILGCEKGPKFLHKNLEQFLEVFPAQDDGIEF